MKKTIVTLLVLAFLFIPCQQTHAPLNLPVCLYLKYVAVPVIAATAYIITKCEPDYFLVCYTDDSTGVRYWAASQANPRTLSKTGGVRWEGPWKSRQEPDFRAWCNNQLECCPMFPMGPLGTIPTPTWTNTLIFQASYTASGGAKRAWSDLSDSATGAKIFVQDIEGENWSVGILPMTGTNGMTSDQLQDYSDCDVIVTNPAPTAVSMAFRAYYTP